MTVPLGTVTRGAPPARYETPTGDPCPRSVRVDGSVDGTGACHACGCCLLLLEAAWPAAVPWS